VIKLLQRPVETRPDGILFEPVGTPLAQAAKMAAEKGVGWVLLNREVEYTPELRKLYKTAVFSITTSHTEVGRIQGQQIAHLLPDGGAVLCITGPADNSASRQRTAGMEETKGPRVEVRFMKGTWSEQSAYQAVSSWLKLSTSREARVNVVAAQNDAMALGARKAFQGLPPGPDRDRWLGLPFIGCDGLRMGGQTAVREGSLTATVVIPPNAGHAIEALVAGIRTGQRPPECIYTVPHSFPQLITLKAVKVVSMEQRRNA
jgi:ribose transport system substrate-binding protein